MDAALFYYGYFLRRASLPEARGIYQRLVKDHGASKFAPEAMLVLGDDYFQANSLSEAEAYYTKILSLPKVDQYPYALYKQIWVQLRSRRYPEALQMSFKLFEITKDAKRLVPLHQAARSLLVRSYAEAGKADQAAVAFDALGTPLSIEVAGELAALYGELGWHDRSAIAYRALMTKLPKHDAFCTWQSGFARATLAKGGKKPKTVDVCKTDVDAFKQWATANGIETK
jgi:tetratricopeptide (TPR) repeat protein